MSVSCRLSLQHIASRSLSSSMYLEYMIHSASLSSNIILDILYTAVNSQNLIPYLVHTHVVRTRTRWERQSSVSLREPVPSYSRCVLWQNMQNWPYRDMCSYPGLLSVGTVVRGYVGRVIFFYVYTGFWESLVALQAAHTCTTLTLSLYIGFFAGRECRPWWEVPYTITIFHVPTCSICTQFRYPSDSKKMFLFLQRRREEPFSMPVL